MRHKYLIHLAFFLLFSGVAQIDNPPVESIEDNNTGTDNAEIIIDSLKSHVRENSRFNWGWQAFCNTEVRKMGEILNDAGVNVEMTPITSGILPEDEPASGFLNGLVAKAREYLPDYEPDFSFMEDMYTIFIASALKEAPIFFIHIPVIENPKVNKFCFGRWEQQ